MDNKIMCPFDIYNPYVKKDKSVNKMMNYETYKHYVDTETSMLMSMFNYEGLPESIDTNYMEWCLVSYGVVAIVKIDNDRYYAGVPALLPPLDDYGHGTTVEMITRNGTIINNRTVGVDCALIWNNNIHLPETDLYRFANMFTETDIALKTVIRNCKKSPIPVAGNSKLKSAIDIAMNNAIEGLSDYTVMNDTSLVDEINGKSSDIPVMSLTDVKDADRLQYLSKFHDDLLRRLATLYGHDMQTSGKMAQQSVDEIQGYDSFSMIYPEVRLDARFKGIKQFNDVFGFNASVDYSLPWRYNIYKQDESDDGVDEEAISDEVVGGETISEEVESDD